MYLNKESLKQQSAARDLIKGLKYRQVAALIETGHLDVNQWLRMEEDMDNEEVTPLILLSRIPATPSEKKEVSGQNCGESIKDGSSRKSSLSGQQGNGQPMTGQGRIQGNGQPMTGQGRIQMAKLLMKHDVDVNMKDARGRTALMYACINGLNDLVSFLLYQGKASYRVQDVDGYNCLMYALPWPTLVRTFIDYMDEYGRPESSFWRQRNRFGKSLIDLAKDPTPGIGSVRSLQILTTFITSSSGYRAPIFSATTLGSGNFSGSEREDNGRGREDHGRGREDHGSGNFTLNLNEREIGKERKGVGSNGKIGSEREDIGKNQEALSSLTMNGGAKPEESVTTLKSSLKSSSKMIDTRSSNVSSDGKSDSRTRSEWKVGGSDQRKKEQDKEMEVLEQQEMKRSKSLKEFWEKEMNDWFSNTPPSSTSSSNDGGDKLPPIRSPIIKYDEWTRRGQSLNRRTSVDFLRSVNPIR